MSEKFQWFNPSVKGLKIPAVYISPTMIYLNRAALYHYFGDDIKHVMIAYSEKKQLLGIKPVSPPNPMALRFSKNGSGIQINCRRFIREGGLVCTKKNRPYTDMEWNGEEGCLVVKDVRNMGKKQ